MNDTPTLLNEAEEIPAPAAPDPELTAEMEQFMAEVQAQMAAKDPRDETYMMRLDTKTLIKSHKEFEACQKNGVPVRYGITFGHALHLVAAEGARNTAKKKRRAANKKARKQRKLNRK